MRQKTSGDLWRRLYGVRTTKGEYTVDSLHGVEVGEFVEVLMGNGQVIDAGVVTYALKKADYKWGVLLRPISNLDFMERACRSKSS